MTTIKEIKAQRARKTDKLKSKILSEISQQLTKYYEIIKQDMGDEERKRAVKVLYALICLEEYINIPYTFNRLYAQYRENNYVDYVIKDTLIEVWSQEHYNFTNHFISKFIEIGSYRVGDMLDDKWLADNLTNPIDIVMYRNRMRG